MVHGVGVEPWAPQCSNHAWAVFRVLCPVERAAFFGSRVWLAVETGQFDFAEPDLAGKHRDSSLKSWAVAPGGLQHVEDGRVSREGSCRQLRLSVGLCASGCCGFWGN